LLDAVGITRVLTTCGAMNNQRDAIQAEGFGQMLDFLILQVEDVLDMMQNITRLAVNRGGTRIGAVLTKKLEALIFWCHERDRTGKDLDANAFTADKMRSAIEHMAVSKGEDEAAPEIPKEFRPVKWVSWSRRMENYLWQVMGKNGVPLAYVIRKDRPPNAPPFASPEEEHVYAVAHQGEAYWKDNAKVMQILTQVLADTPAWTWISRFENTKNGRSVLMALRAHYDGPGKVEKQISHAYSEISESHYKSKRMFSFEKYVTKLSEAFEILADYQVGKQECEKVDILLNGIQSDNQIVISAKTTVCMHPNMRTSFQVAVDRLLELIGSTMQSASKQGQVPAQ